MRGLFVSWSEQLRNMLQEVLIVGENHVVQGMVVAQEYASVVFRFLEGDTVAEKRHAVDLRQMVRRAKVEFVG